MVDDVMRPGSGHLITFVGGPNAGQQNRIFGHNEGDVIPVHILKPEWGGAEDDGQHWTTHIYRVEGNHALYIGITPED